MKIIELKNNHKGHWRHTCSNCGTVFEFDKDDAAGSFDEDNEYYYTVKCPNCKDLSFDTAWEEFT